MIRRLFATASAISLLLGAALIALLARSFLSDEEWVIAHSTRLGPRGQTSLLVTFVSCRGRAELHVERTRIPDVEALYREFNVTTSPGSAGWELEHRSPPVTPPRDRRTPLERIGFRFEHNRFEVGAGGSAWFIVGVPFWFLLAVALILPAAWFNVRRIRSKRRRLFLCPTCGYDLRASTGRCPECGTPIRKRWGRPHDRPSNGDECVGAA